MTYAQKYLLPKKMIHGFSSKIQLKFALESILLKGESFKLLMTGGTEWENVDDIKTVYTKAFGVPQVKQLTEYSVFQNVTLWKFTKNLYTIRSFYQTSLTTFVVLVSEKHSFNLLKKDKFLLA